MSLLSKSNIQTGNIVLAQDVYQIVDALTASGSYDILISGSLVIGSGSINPLFKTFIKGNLGVDGNISGSGITGSFNGNGQNITGVVSSSYSISSSLSQNSISSSRSVSSSFASTASFAITSSNAITASYALFAANASSGGGGGNISGSGTNGFITKFTSPVSGIFYITSSTFISESNNRVLILTGSSFSNDISVAGQLAANGGITSSNATFSGILSASTFYQYSSTSNILLQNGSGSFTGTVTAPAFFQSSLRVLKDNIKPFEENAVEILNSVDIVSFNYKKTPDMYSIGFIADETHEYLSTKDHNVLNVNNTVGLLIKSIQELTREIFELRARINKLEKGDI